MEPVCLLYFSHYKKVVAEPFSAGVAVLIHLLELVSTPYKLLVVTPAESRPLFRVKSRKQLTYDGAVETEQVCAEQGITRLAMAIQMVGRPKVESRFLAKAR